MIRELSVIESTYQCAIMHSICRIRLAHLPLDRHLQSQLAEARAAAQTNERARQTMGTACMWRGPGCQRSYEYLAFGLAHQHRGTEQRTLNSAHMQCGKRATPGANENQYILPFSHKGKRSSPNGCVSFKTNLNTTVSMGYSAGVLGARFVEPDEVLK